jgi:ABC-type sugar transport system ATPase subunit
MRRKITLTEQPFVLEMRGISKRFPGVQALDDVSFQLQPSEVHALLGENGAGKSTLIKILAGDYQRDQGEIFIDGQQVQIETPAQSANQGVSVIYQEMHLISSLSVAENIMLGLGES